MRIAFFGGSFDPPHLGHAHIAREAADRLHLDRVLFAPVALQPLKHRNVRPAPFFDRMAMLRSMLAEPGVADPRFEVSDLDAPRADGRANYTYETLLALRPPLTSSPDELFVLAGADSLLTLPQWHRAADLLPLASWIIAARPGFPHRELLNALLSIRSPSELRRLESASPEVEHLGLVSLREPALPVHLYLLPDLSEQVSATAIRAALAEGEDPAGTGLAPAVRLYIRSHGLYRPEEPAGYDRA